MPAIVLVHTQLPGNIGFVCRSMRNFGFTQLVLVRPQCDPHHEDARAYAAGAHQLVGDARICEDLDEALEPYAVSLGFTRRSGRTRQLDGDLHGFLPAFAREHPDWIGAMAYVFGPEESGLSNEHIRRCDHLVKLPTLDPHGSMNLSHAVTCACYETIRLFGAPVEDIAPEQGLALNQARGQVLEALLEQLDDIDFYTVEPKQVVEHRLRRILAHSMLNGHDLHFLQKFLAKYRRLSPSQPPDPAT